MRHILVVATLPAARPVVPSTAALATDAGQIVFTGTATLPAFPATTPPPFGTGPGAGSLTGEWSGHATGTAAGGEFDVTWLLGILSASFSYYEFQCDTPSTLLGAAFGTGTAHSGGGNVLGSWQGTKGRPRDIVEVRSSFTFQWTRAAETAVLTFGELDVDVDVWGIGWVRIATGALPATVTSVPETVDDGPPANVKRVVAGDVTFVG